MKHLLQKTIALKALLLVGLLVNAVSGAWAEDVTSTLTFAAKCNGSGIADDGVTWTVSSDGTESNYESTRGIHYGTNSAQVQYIKLSTSEIEGTITKVVVNASTASGVSATVGVSVGDEAFGGAAKTLSSTATDYTFEGSAEGEIIVTVTKPSQAAKALFVKSVAVTYTTGGGSTPIKEDCDLALTDAPIALTFDMYNNSTAQYISYTTSSTGEITAESNAAVSCYADPETKTISVTPFASTNGKPLVITLNQAADENYKAGSVTFTVTVTDNTPEDPSKVTIWSEDFSSFSASDVPTKGTNATYTCTNGGSDTKIYEEARAGGTSPELLVSKNNGVFSVVITDLKGCDGEMSLSFITNRTDLVVTIKPDKSWGTTTSGTIKSGTTSTLTFDIPSGTKKLTIDFSMTNSSNARLDDIVLIGKSDGKEDNGLSFSSETASAVIGGESSIFPTLTNPNDLAVTYSSSDEKVAVINEEGVITLVAAGETTITATFAGNDDYKAGSASYVLTVTAANQVATPVIAFGATTFFESTTATITCATEGATILYSTDNGENWQTYSEAITLTETTTIIAKATKEGATDSQICEAATATKNSVEADLATLAAKEAGTYYVNLNNVVVTYVNGNNAYLQDASGAILLYKNGHGFTAGQVINGVASVTLQIRSNNPQLTALTGAEGYSVVNGTAPEPTTIAAADWNTAISTVLSQYVKVTGATITLENSKYYVQLGEEKVQLYGQGDARTISVEDLEAPYTIVGFPTMYNTTPELVIYVQPEKEEAVDERAEVTLSFNPEELNAILGETFTAPTLTIKDAKGEDVTGLTITYSVVASGDSPIEINPETGEVTLKAEGEANVVATFEGNTEYKQATASYKLHVLSNKAASNLAIGTLSSNTLSIGDIIKLTYTTSSNGAITWKSSKEDVLTVDQEGNLEAVAVGEATITLTQSETEAYQAGEATIELTVVDPNQREFYWELAKASYSSASTEKVVWTSDYATMDVTRAEGGTAANNYLGGDKYTSTRFYTNSTLTITPAEGYRIASVLFQATTAGYATTFKNSTWTNAEEVVLSGENDVTITPTDGMEAIVATIGGTCGFNKVLVTYAKAGEVVSEPSITLKQYEYNVNADGGDAELIVTCSNMPEDPQLAVVFVEADGETATTYGWITAVINGEGNIAGHMDANTGEARTAYFVVTGVDGDENVVTSQLITIHQAAPAAPSITVEKGSIDFAAGGESDRKLSFGYESLGSNPTFEICFFDREGNVATYEWVTTATIEDNKVNLAVAANDGEARAAYFKVHAVGTEVYSNLVTINQAAYVVDFATLPFSWDGGASVDLKDLNGVTTNGLGSDYGESHKPYLVKFDGDNDYIQVKTDSRPGVVSVGVKMIGGGNTSKITVQESVDGVTFTDVQELTISGKQNDILTLETANAFAEDSRYVRLTFTKGSNIGVGPISIAQYVAPSTEPSIEVRKTEVAAAAEGAEGIIDVTYKNITNVAADVKFVDAKGEAATYDWIDADINEESNVVYVIGENTDTEARTAYMQVYALDDEANYVYSEIITVTQDGYVAPLPATTYSLATTITSGKHYLIVGENNGVYQAMGEQKSNNRAAVNVTLDGDKISITDEAVKEVVICGPDVNGFYTIYESGYLYAASSGSNNLKSATTADTNGLWQIDFNAATGEASVIASGSLNRNVMQYNATSGLFSCYVSASQKPVYFYERDDEETPVASYTRDVASVKWGTICLPNVATITGAQLYSIAGKDKDEDPSALYLTEVKGTAAAGTPYIFKPTASVINAYYTGDAATEAGSANGLIGSFTGTSIEEGMYLLSKGEIVLCGTGCSIAANRAYIDMSKVRVVNGEEAGVKLNIGGGEDGVSSLDAASEGAVIYDLSGRRVSKTAKGLYIINGKKVSVK